MKAVHLLTLLVCAIAICASPNSRLLSSRVGLPWTMIQYTTGPGSCWAAPVMPLVTCQLPGMLCNLRSHSAQSMLTRSVI